MKKIWHCSRQKKRKWVFCNFFEGGGRVWNFMKVPLGKGSVPFMIKLSPSFKEYSWGWSCVQASDNQEVLYICSKGIALLNWKCSWCKKYNHRWVEYRSIMHNDFIPYITISNTDIFKKRLNERNPLFQSYPKMMGFHHTLLVTCSWKKALPFQPGGNLSLSY